MKNLFLALVSLFSLATFATEPTPPIIDLTAIDSHVDPCNDFYHYACGAWLEHFELPSDKSSYYRESSGLQDQVDEQLNGILVKYAAGDFSSPSPYAQKLGDYYASCMDVAGTESDALTVLALQFVKVDMIRNSQDLAEAVAALHLQGSRALFSFSGAQDLNDSTKFIGFLGEGGFSLPELSYYTKTDAKSVEIRTKLEEHIAHQIALTFPPQTDAVATAHAITLLENELGTHAMSLADRNDSSKVNHPTDRAGLKALAPLFDWDHYFAAMGVTTLDTFNDMEPDFLKAMNDLLAKTPLESWKPYLKWQIVRSLAGSLTSKTDQENFAFWSQYLNGQKEQPARWKRCTQDVEGSLREALGQAYIASQPDAEKIRDATRSMVKDIEAAFSANLNILDWLDDPTRKAAQEKLTLVGAKVGWPDQWRNYDSMSVVRVGYARNVVAANVFESKRTLARIGQPVDKSLWDMAPWEANAYYDPSMNEMVLPLGELVPPVMDLNATEGANLGSLGATTIGHELTHGFDSNGRQFDGHGNLKEWWTPAVKAEFDQRTQCLVDQASAYEVLPGLNVVGAQVLTENLADQGGAKLALTVLAQHQAQRGPGKPLAQFDENQQFFLSFAQAWCAKRTDANLRVQVTSNEHPPEEFRVNGVLFNRPEFAKAFQCKPGSRMAPVKQCQVW